MFDKKIIKKPHISSEVYYIKNIILQELAHLKVQIEEEKAEVLAERIVHQTEESQRQKLLGEKDKKIEEVEDKLKQKEEEIKNKELRLIELNKILKENEDKEKELTESIKEKEGRQKALSLEVEKLEKRHQEVLTKINEVQKSAFEEGYLEGQKVGQDVGKKEIINRLQFVEGLIRETEEEIQRIIKRTNKEMEEILESSEKEAVKLALDIARKITRSEITTHPEIIAKVAKESLRRVVESQKVKIRISPSDLEILKNYRQEIMAAQEGVKNLEIIVDERIEPGGCVLETEKDTIDAKIGTQLEQIEKGLGV